MYTRVIVVSLAFAAALGISSAAAEQHEMHGPNVGATPSAVQVADCRRAQPIVTGLLNAALKRLEDARLTNSAAAMRDAADDVQVALVDTRTQLAPCGGMELAAAPASAAPSATVPDVAAPAEHAMPMPAASGSAAPQMAPMPPAARPSTAQPRSAPIAADPHAGHMMGTPQPPSPPGTSVVGATPPTAPRPIAEGGRGAPTARAMPSPPDPAAASAPPTDLAALRCTNAVDRRTAPRMLFQGRMYYFCTEASRAEFAKAPGKFVTPPPQAAPAPAAPAHVH